jgi:hypothetical protein
VLGALVLLGLSAGAGATANAAARHRPHTVNARVSATFIMHGRIVTAVRVKGEHRGQRITRRWTFAGQNCTRNVCRRLLLTRERSAGLYDHLILSRTGVGRYAGNGRFYAALECKGAIYPEGQAVPYRVTVAVTRAVAIQGTKFATALTATYTNKRRADRTICPTGPSHDAAIYSGTASPGPSPPSAAFSTAVSPGGDTATFTSTSSPGGDQAAIAGYAWNFGDPGSGPANGATAPQASHTFTRPGAYTVALTVTDVNGLAKTASAQVVVPAP